MIYSGKIIIIGSIDPSHLNNSDCGQAIIAYRHDLRKYALNQWSMYYLWYTEWLYITYKL